jgi:hypothetical protein
VDGFLGLEVVLIYYSNPPQPAVRGRCPRRYLKWENIENHFPGQAEVERQSNCENLWPVCLWRHTLLINFIKCAEASDTLAYVVSCIFYKFFYIIALIDKLFCEELVCRHMLAALWWR